MLIFSQSLDIVLILKEMNGSLLCVFWWCSNVFNSISWRLFFVSLFLSRFRETIFCFACSFSSYWSCHHDIDVEFWRPQARDMLQHLWPSPISNASMEVVQGSRSVEVQAANVTKGIVFLIIDFSQFCFHLQNFHSDLIKELITFCV